MSPKGKESSKGPRGAPLDPVRKHDLLNLFILPWIALLSIYATATGDRCAWVVHSMICYMLLDALYIALNPKAVPSVKLVLFHHLMSIFGLSHGIRFKDTSERLVAAYGLIEIHTVFMTYRRFTGIRSAWSEFWFQVVTVLIRLVCIPALLYFSYWDISNLGLFGKLDGLPSMLAVAGLNFFNVQFLLKRKAMFNYSAQSQAFKKKT